MRGADTQRETLLTPMSPFDRMYGPIGRESIPPDRHLEAALPMAF